MKQWMALVAILALLATATPVLADDRPAADEGLMSWLTGAIGPWLDLSVFAAKSGGGDEPNPPAPPEDGGDEVDPEYGMMIEPSG